MLHHEWKKDQQGCNTVNLMLSYETQRLRLGHKNEIVQVNVILTFP